MDIATGTWFRRLREGTEGTQKQIITEISQEEIDRLEDWLSEQGDFINPELDDLFGGRGKMRVAFPLAGEDARNLAQIVSALMSEGWRPPATEHGHGPRQFQRKEVKQKGKRRVGELPVGFGQVDPETNPDPRPVEEFYTDKTVAVLNLERKFDFTIPAGPRKGENIEKTERSTMSRAIAKLVKQGKISKELLEWWNNKQIYYTNDHKWEDVEELFDMTSSAHKYTIIVSRDPIDVLRMSDIGRISSCHREGGEYFQCAVSESRGTGIIAYRVRTEELDRLLAGEGSDLEIAQEVVEATILNNDKRFNALHKRLNDAEMFDFGVNAIKDELRVKPDVKEYITPDMVRDAMRAKLDDKPWPPPTLNPDVELKSLSDFDSEEIFQDSDRDVEGIEAYERVRMRKYYDTASDHWFVVPELRPYGAKQPGFVKAVRGWAWDNQKDIFVDDEGETYYPREEYLQRHGASYEDNRDGQLFNVFFAEGTDSSVTRYQNTNFEKVVPEVEDDPTSSLEAQLQEAREQIDEIMDAASNRTEHLSFVGSAEMAEFAEFIYVYGAADAQFQFPLGWEGDVERGEDGWHFPEDDRQKKAIPRAYGGVDWKVGRRFTNMIEDKLGSYADDIGWEIVESRSEGYDLVISANFICDACEDVGDFDNFVDGLIDEVDDKYDEIYEKIRRELFLSGYIAASDWDTLYDDLEEADNTLENWYGVGVGDEDYDGEVWFWFKPGTASGGLFPTSVKLDPRIGNTPYSLEKIFKNEGRVGLGGKVSPGPQFMKRLSLVLADLEAQANGYAENQLDLAFGDKYARPTYEGITFAKNAQLLFELAGDNMINGFLKVQLKSNNSREEIEGALAFMKYVDQYPEFIMKGISDNLKVYVNEYIDYLKARTQKMEDGTTFMEMYNRIRSKYLAQADLGNADAESAMLLAMWGRDNWDKMSDVEKYTLVDVYMRPLVTGAFHPRNAWSHMSNIPLNWNNFVQQKMRGEQFRAPGVVARNYSWFTAHPEDAKQARQTTEPPSNENVEEQILRIDKLLNERYDQRIYKMAVLILAQKLEGRETDDLKNAIRGIKDVTTVVTVGSRNVGTATEYQFDVKYRQEGQKARDWFIKDILAPALRQMPGIEIKDWSAPQLYDTSLKEYFMPNTYSTAMTTPAASLDQISRDWVEGGVRLYDMPAHAQDMEYHLMMPVEELLPYTSRIYRAPMDAFEGRYHHFIKKGPQAPVFVVVGQNGRIKIAGNEDIVWFAKKAGLKEVPVFVRYQKQA